MALTEAQLLSKISADFIESTTPVLEEQTGKIARYTFSGIKKDGSSAVFRTYQFYVDTVADEAFFGRIEDVKEEILSFIESKQQADQIDSGEMIKFDEQSKSGIVRSMHVVTGKATFKYWFVYFDKTETIQFNEIDWTTYQDHLK